MLLQKLRDVLPHTYTQHSLNHICKWSTSPFKSVPPGKKIPARTSRIRLELRSIRTLVTAAMGEPQWPASKVRQTFLDFFRDYKSYEHEVGR